MPAMLPKGLRRFEIKTNWPIVDVRAHQFVASSPASAWRKFCEQRFGALKPDPKEWTVKLLPE